MTAVRGQRRCIIYLFIIWVHFSWEWRSVLHTLKYAFLKGFNQELLIFGVKQSILQCQGRNIYLELFCSFNFNHSHHATLLAADPRHQKHLQVGLPCCGNVYTRVLGPDTAMPHSNCKMLRLWENVLILDALTTVRLSQLGFDSSTMQCIHVRVEGKSLTFLCPLFKNVR